MTKSSYHLHVCQLAFHLWDCISASLALASPDFTPPQSTSSIPGPLWDSLSLNKSFFQLPLLSQRPLLDTTEASLGSGSLAPPQLMDVIFKSQMALTPLTVTALLSMFHVELESVSCPFKCYKIPQGYMNGDTYDSVTYRVLRKEASEFLVIA